MSDRRSESLVVIDVTGSRSGVRGYRLPLAPHLDLARHVEHATGQADQPAGNAGADGEAAGHADGQGQALHHVLGRKPQEYRISQNHSPREKAGPSRPGSGVPAV